MSNNTSIECIKVKDVYDFACENLPNMAADEIAPISKTRAKAWTTNPHASPDDVALIVAKDKDTNQTAGYIGMMPGKLTCEDGEESVHWLSTFYVPPERRESGLGAMLLMRAMSLNKTLAACGSSESAIAAYRALRFVEPTPLVYYQLDAYRKNVIGGPFRAARKLLRKVGRESKTLDRLVAWSNNISKGMLYRKLRRSLHVDNISIRDLPNVEGIEVQEFQGDRHPFRFFRDKEVMQWMMEEHWVSTNPEERQENYFFDDFRKEFQYRVVEVRRDGDDAPAGFVVLWLLQRDEVRDVRVLDYHFERTENYETIAAVAIEAAEQFRADRLFLPDICEPFILMSSVASKQFERQERPCFIRVRNTNKELAAKIDQISLHYCDGDIPFA